MPPATARRAPVGAHSAAAARRASVGEHSVSSRVPHLIRRRSAPAALLPDDERSSKHGGLLLASQRQLRQEEEHLAELFAQEEATLLQAALARRQDAATEVEEKREKEEEEQEEHEEQAHEEELPQECAICLEPLERPTYWPADCGHIFCYSCVEKCARADHTLRCPLCRKAPPRPPRPKRRPPPTWTLVPTPSGGLAVNLNQRGEGSEISAGQPVMRGSNEVELEMRDYFRLLERGPPRPRLRDRAAARLRLGGARRAAALPVPASRYRAPRPGFFERLAIEFTEGVIELIDML